MIWPLVVAIGFFLLDATWLDLPWKLLNKTSTILDRGWKNAPIHPICGVNIEKKLSNKILDLHKFTRTIASVTSTITRFLFVLQSIILGNTLSFYRKIS